MSLLTNNWRLRRTEHRFYDKIGNRYHIERETASSSGSFTTMTNKDVSSAKRWILLLIFLTEPWGTPVFTLLQVKEKPSGDTFVLPI